MRNFKLSLVFQENMYFNQEGKFRKYYCLYMRVYPNPVLTHCPCIFFAFACGKASGRVVLLQETYLHTPPIINDYLGSKQVSSFLWKDTSFVFPTYIFGHFVSAFLKGASFSKSNLNNYDLLDPALEIWQISFVH